MAVDYLIIAIDGPAGSGKSTLAKGLARKLGLTYLDTGATYRALALKSMQEDIDPSDLEATTHLAEEVNINFVPDYERAGDARVILDGIDVTESIRSPEVSETASTISRNPNVRRTLVEIQREISKKLCESGCKGIAIEGRDIGTVVFPDARLKIFLTASLDERTKRRMSDDGEDSNVHRAFQDTKAAILARDISDQTRDASPLKPASDAIPLDNSSWEIEETLGNVIELIESLDLL